jgi:hypothetical protein
MIVDKQRIIDVALDNKIRIKEGDSDDFKTNL